MVGGGGPVEAVEIAYFARKTFPVVLECTGPGQPQIRVSDQEHESKMRTLSQVEAQRVYDQVGKKLDALPYYEDCATDELAHCGSFGTARPCSSLVVEPVASRLVCSGIIFRFPPQGTRDHPSTRPAARGLDLPSRFGPSEIRPLAISSAV